MIYRVNFETADGCHHVLDCLSWSFDEDSICLTDLDGNEFVYYRYDFRDCDPESIGIINGSRYISTISIKEVKEYAV